MVFLQFFLHKKNRGGSFGCIMCDARSHVRGIDNSNMTLLGGRNGGTHVGRTCVTSSASVCRFSKGDQIHHPPHEKGWQCFSFKKPRRFFLFAPFKVLLLLQVQ
ncbi:hypothetical protein COU76_00420 [Candidatus Peregrinibacteria bacterium CG10_big_fil_rev_8_21_14_0_10_49_10]|nr:MAG: hypothetical protein COU76_00420 [Candidatus Peregrinibacteria bacterium CG10_big_fil_rev_8_21_14_0_10_49_10]